jgi:chromosome partitioning protein
VIPTVRAGLDTLGLVQTIEVLREKGTSNFTVRTKVPAPPEQEGEELRGHLSAMAIPVLKSSIPRLKAFDRAYYAGVPVNMVHDPRSARAWKAYTAFGKEIPNA